MISASPPTISVVLVTADGLHALRKTIVHLCRQTIADQIEIVIVTPEPSHIDTADSDLDGVHSVTVIPCSADRRLGAARAAGVHAAHAQLVAFTEDHCFPAPACMEAFVRRHAAGCDVVGPAMENANPRTARSWCAFLLDYGQWASAERAHRVDTVPGHNSSYRRQRLLELGEDLETLLAAETVLHWIIRDDGGTLMLDPAARTAHVNMSRLRAILKSRLVASRAFAGVWSRDWTIRRRAYLAVLSPWITLRQFGRIITLPGTLSAAAPSPARLAPLLLLCAIPCCLGYILGFAAGAGRTLEHAWDMEVGKRAALIVAEDCVILHVN